MKKSFKTGSKKGSDNKGIETLLDQEEPNQPHSKISQFTSAEAGLPPLGTGPTTRKTIEVPEDYFYRVKRHALDRRMKEKDLWAEILYEYFMSHPSS